MSSSSGFKVVIISRSAKIKLQPLKLGGQQMKKQLGILVLLVVFASLGMQSSNAQVATTGPAGLARQMPRIYGPYMANRARIKYAQKHKKMSHKKSNKPRPRRS